MGGRIALYTALTVPVERLVLVGASPGIADPAERAARRAADDALADRIETLEIEAFAREWGSQPLFAGQPRAGRGRAPTRTGCGTRRPGSRRRCAAWGRA